MYSFRELMFPYPATDVLGAQLKGIGNPDLGWSKTKNRSVALEDVYKRQIFVSMLLRGVEGFGKLLREG